MARRGRGLNPLEKAKGIWARRMARTIVFIRFKWERNRSLSPLQKQMRKITAYHLHRKEGAGFSLFHSPGIDDLDSLALSPPPGPAPALSVRTFYSPQY